ncbi:MAG: 23S rRNA (adenine(2503)-C(2))-methyltransferase RlmN [Zetaproteobacteria bacterium]|nr:23S rRNA (adenine(2503)-C(2))-methyltransferase RlmN [Zetaproteobacteria bacterium]
MLFSEIEQLCRDQQIKPSHAERLNAAIYRHRNLDIAHIEGLPHNFRHWLAQQTQPIAAQAISDQQSQDGTRKFLFRMEDGSDIETVHIPTANRLTQCISTQVGCAMGCGFCLTAQLGLKRQLRAAEMVSQIFLAAQISGQMPRNLVLMGMGEPLHNYDEVSRFVRIVTDPKGMAFSPRRVTLSTSGIVPGIYRMIEERLPCNLAVSLNATDDATRDQIMPINRKYPLATLMRAVTDYIAAYDHKRVLIEYVMLQGVNDSLADAERLIAWINHLGCTINLLPFNAFHDTAYKSPSIETVSQFRQRLVEAGIVTVVRESRGMDISAACGQLQAENSNNRD